MTAKKKKPFWVKLLSAVLVASMLMGSAGISSFAASDSPDGKTGVEEPVSNESAGDEKNTAETPETSAANEAAQDLEDTGKTGAGEDTKTAEDVDVSDTEGNLQSKEETGTSDVEDNQQSKEEAGTSDVEESLKDKTEGDISSETGDEDAPSDETDTENGGVTPGTSDAVNDAEEETEELPETEPVNEEVPAEVQAFLDAVAAIPEITPENAVEVAEYIYGPVSEAYEVLLGTEFMERDDVKVAEEVYGQAVADVEAALELGLTTFAKIPMGVGTTDSNVSQTAFLTYEEWSKGEKPALGVSGNWADENIYGAVYVDPDGTTETVDCGNQTFYTYYGIAVSTNWQENGGVPSVVRCPSWLNVSLRAEGGVLYVIFTTKPGAQAGQNGTVKLSYTASWAVVTNNAFEGEDNGKVTGDIYYNVTVGDGIPSEPGAPRKPNTDEINYWSNEQALGIRAACSLAKTTNHGKAFWPYTVATYPDSYSLGPVVKNTGSNASQYPWICTLTVNNDWWAEKFSTYNAANWPYNYGPHRVDTEKTGTLTSTFYWTGSKWVNLDENGQVLTVWVTCKPAKPTESTIGNAYVAVQCSDTSTHKAGGKNVSSYSLANNSGGWTASEPMATTNADGNFYAAGIKWKSVLTLNNSYWADKYDSNGHELNASKTGTITITAYWYNNNWAFNSQDNVRTVYVKDPKSTTYTVVHEYYTNGMRDGLTKNTVNNVHVGDVVKVSDIPKVYEYTQGGKKNTYIYKRANQGVGANNADGYTVGAELTELTLVDGTNIIVLRYERNNLEVTKTPSEKYPIIGTEFNYTITVENPQSKSAIVTITDKLNEKLKYVAVSDGGSYDETTKTVTWTGIQVPPNGTKTVKVWVKATAAGDIYNEANAGIDGEDVTGSDSTEITAKREFVLHYNEKLSSDTGTAQVTKMPTPNPSDPTASENMSYTLKISDTVPERGGYTFKHWQWGDDPDKIYAPGADITLTADAETQEKVTAELYAVWEKTDDFEVEKVRTSGDTAKAGDTITWNIIITNNSKTTDKTVTVEDILGGVAGSAVVKNGESTIGKDDKVTVPKESSVTLTASYDVKKEDVGKTITNKVKVTDEEDKDHPKEADDGSGVTIDGTPELTITKEVDKASVKVGNPLTYTITVTNEGDGDATEVKVSDTLPKELANSIQDSTPVSYQMSMEQDAATFTWNLGTIEAGESGTVKFTVKTEKAGKIENGASVKSDEITTPVETEEPAKTTIYDLEVTKKNDGFKVNEVTGIAAVHYTVTVENKSGFALYGLDIIDTLETEVKDTKNDPISTVKMTLKPVSLKLDGEDIGTPGDESEPEANKEGQVRTWNVLPRSEEFEDGSTVTLVYDIEIENTGDTGVQVNLDNRAKGGSWTTGENSLSPARKILRRAFVRTGRSSDPYDAEDEDGSSASGGTSSTGGFIPVKKTFELVYDLKGGSNGPANQTVTTTQESVTYHEFNVAGKETSIAIPTNGEKVFKGWAEAEDGDVKYAFDSETKSYNPEKVTVALESGKTASKTLYAVWAEPTRKITVKYWAEGADPDSDEPLKTEIITVIDGKPIVDGDKYKETDLVTVEDIDKDGNHYIVETIPSSDEKTVAGDVVIDVICTLDNKTDEENDGNGDKPGDGIPDKYQKEVKFVAVNGSFDPDDETVTGKTVVVTLFDSDNKPSENGIGHLTEEQIPEATPNTDYEGNGTWNPEIPTVEYEITEDKTFTIVFTNGNALTVGAGDVTVTYDGAEHPVVPGVSDPDADVKVEYRRADENGALVGDPLDEAPKDAGTYIATITATLPDGTTASSEAKVVINKRGLTVTTGSGSKTFDNTPLTNSTAAVTVQGGNVDGEIITATATGSQTAVGSSTNGYEIDWDALGINPDNYEITAVLGTLTVNAAAPTTPSTDGGGTGGGGGTNPEPTPATPEPTPTTPEPTPIVPEPVPTVGPVQTVPTVTPVAPTSTVPTPTAALASPTPEMAELSDEDVPLAGEGEKEEPETVIKPAELEDEAVPMAAGKGLSWALINFALMNLAVFESLMLLIGYFIKTKGSSEEDEEEKKKLKKKGIMRIISLPVAVISVIAFILTEDITLPTAFVDRYTIWMAVIAIVQTAVVALSRKEVKDEEEQKAEA